MWLCQRVEKRRPCRELRALFVRKTNRGKDANSLALSFWWEQCLVSLVWCVMLEVSYFVTHLSAFLGAFGCALRKQCSVMALAKLSDQRCQGLICACSKTAVYAGLCLKAAMCSWVCAIKFLYLISRVERGPFASSGSCFLPVNCMET